MYEAYFGLKDRPFAAMPRTDRYAPVATLEAAREAIVAAVERGAGPALAIGGVGVGKSLLCRRLEEDLAHIARVGVLESGRMSKRRAVLQAILFELRRPYKDLDDHELRLAVREAASTAPIQGRPPGLVLIVDEAHTLTAGVLDELRVLTDQSQDGNPLVRLVLVGGTQLEEHLTHPRLESLAQRIAVRCYLEPMTRAETSNYVRSQLKLCGGAPDNVFAPAGLEAVYRATDGVPRLVNQLCDHALVLAMAGGSQQVEAPAVDEAWADLQQLPTPWQAHAIAARPRGGVIEFGQLDEGDDEAEAAVSRRGRVSSHNEDLSDEADDEVAAIPIHGRFAPPAREEQANVSPYERIAHSSYGMSAAANPADAVDGDDEEFAAGDFRPKHAPEVEIDFAPVDDPFADPFADEESIVDTVAQLEITRPAKPGATPATTAAAATPATPAASAADHAPATSHDDDQSQLDELSEDNAFDPLTAFAQYSATSPEPTAVSKTSTSKPAAIPTVPLKVPAAVATDSPPPKRREFGRLFSKLRGPDRS